MARHYSQRIGRTSPYAPPVSPLNGGRVMSFRPMRNVLTAQDTVVGLTRRAVCRWGLDGAASWFALDDASPAGTSQTFPEMGVYRTVHRVAARITPGAFMRCRITYVPSGAREENSGGTWTVINAGGRVKLTVIWRNPDDMGDTVTTTHEVGLAGSGLFQGTNPGAEPDGDGDTWNNLQTAWIENIRPIDVLTDVTEANKWTRGAVVEIQVQEEGGARVVDGCIWEEPWGIAFEADDPVPPAHIIDATGTLQILGSKFPVQRATETTPDGDPRSGTWHTLDVNDEMATQLGPMLFGWSAWNQEDPAIADTSHSVSYTSLTWKDVNDSDKTEYDPDWFGWLAGSGYARKHQWSDPDLSLPGTAVIPVRVWVYAEPDGTNTCAVRVYSSEESFVEVTITGGGSTGWYTAPGFLRVGITPEEQRTVQAFARMAGAGTCEIHSICAHHEDRGPAQ